MKAESFAKDKKFFCDPAKLLPLSRFLPQPKRPAGKVAKSPGGYVSLASIFFSMNCSAEEVAEDEAVLAAAVEEEVEEDSAEDAEADEVDSAEDAEADSVAVEAAAEAVVSAAEDEAAAAARAASSESSTERCEEKKLVPPDCPAILLGQYYYDCSFLFLTLCSVTNANAF